MSIYGIKKIMNKMKGKLSESISKDRKIVWIMIRNSGFSRLAYALQLSSWTWTWKQVQGCQPWFLNPIHLYFDSVCMDPRLVSVYCNKKKQNKIKNIHFVYILNYTFFFLDLISREKSRNQTKKNQAFV